MSTQPVSDTSGNVRQRLLDAALQLFSSKGYAATSVRELVEAAGVTKPVLYYYFKNKEGLYLALLGDGLAEFHQVAEQARLAPGSVRERICGYCTALLDIFVGRLPVARLIYAIYYGPPQGAPHIDFEASFSTMLAHMEQLVNEGISTGEFRKVDPVDTAWAIVALLNTAMEEQFNQTKPVRVDRAGLLRLLSLLFEGIRK
ncbi:TetR/AcrR family transcriptional regulator [Trichlorobacter lovleyi]|uniref:TetR/AcrR family transcriptional regulator n=1 Tax=Trichlorobacter lovleyi TaxID=313985 RepID=UPI002240505F|nr:TetR/AcrR family transcriptional regulator [Trichlorobacter lovleyi]QOX77556.1 TetR/AcrR family transcriptional regulator [Trichlorobacter lovleyi]